MSLEDEVIFNKTSREKQTVGKHERKINYFNY